MPVYFRSNRKVIVVIPDLCNYRPITITPTISRVFQRVMNNRFIRHLELNGHTSSNQYLFRSLGSKWDLLSHCTTIWLEVFGKYGETRAFSLDISKAFDGLWHLVFLSKLPRFFNSPFVSLIESFLQCRSRIVAIDVSKSEKFFLDYGVPRVSVLSPTLFFIFINQLFFMFNQSSGFKKSPNNYLLSNSRQEKILYHEKYLAFIHFKEMKNVI